MTRARCVACREMISGSREETFQWLRYHQTLHALHTTDCTAPIQVFRYRLDP